MGRYDLTDKEYALIEDLVNYTPSRGAKPKYIREALNAMFWILCTGAPWRDLPSYYPAWKTVYDRFRIYADNGILDAVLERLMKHANEDRKLFLEIIAIDGTYVKAHRHAAGAKKKKDRPPKNLKQNKVSDVPEVDLPAKST